MRPTLPGIGGDGEESGIRYLDVLLGSVSYRFQVAARPIFAIRSIDHCTLLHAGPVSQAEYRTDHERAKDTAQRDFIVGMDSRL